MCFRLKSGCKGKRFIFNHQMFSKVFFELFSGGWLHAPKGLIPSRSLSPAKVATGAESFIKEKLSYACLTKSVTHCFSAASLSIAGAKVGGFNLTAKHII